MQYAVLGETGISVSRLCFGTLTMGPLQKNLPIDQGAGLLELAFSLGVNFVDTAELYGTYPYIKAAMRYKPDMVICTKSYCYDAASAAESFQKAVEGMGREYIDIFLLHEQESEHTIRGHWQAVEYLLKKKDQGMIGAIGLSTHYVAGMAGANKYDCMKILFPLINVAGLGIADGTKEEMEAQIKIAAEKNKGVFAMKPFGGGHLIGKREEALKYLFGMPEIASIAVGMQTEQEVRFNAAVFSGETPDADVVAGIALQPRELFIQDWCEGCGECVKRCRNQAMQMIDNKAVAIKGKCALCGYCAAVCPQFCIKVV